MSGSVIFEEQVEIPLDLRSLAEFRRWALSDDFPERGRIDYIDGRIEVDMSPEELYVHGTVKAQVARMLGNRIDETDFGDIFIDSTRVSDVRAKLSAEPDIVFVSHESLDRGVVKRVETAAGGQGRYVELKGGPDIIVEIMSDSSILKDTRRLPRAYFVAGVREFWLIDSRDDELFFRIHRRGPRAFKPVVADDEGFQRSDVMRCSYRLTRTWDDRRRRWKFKLLEKEERS